VLPAHAAVVHAIFMHRLQPLIKESLRHFSHPFKNLWWRGASIIIWLKGHNPNKLGAQPFHARHGALHLGQCSLKGCLNGLLPVANG
jgi:hypothetical protein